MERRVLKVVVIRRDEDREADEQQRDDQSVNPASLVRETAVAADAGGVYHGQLVDELHGVFECRVEEEGSGAHGGVACEGDEEDLVVAMLEARADAEQGEEDKEAIGDGVDDLGGEGREPVVLLAPVDRAGDGKPAASVGVAGRIAYGRKPGKHAGQSERMVCLQRKSADDVKELYCERSGCSEWQSGAKAKGGVKEGFVRRLAATNGH